MAKLSTATTNTGRVVGLKTRELRMSIDKNSTFRSNELQGSEPRRAAFSGDRDARYPCYPLHTMTKTPAPQSPLEPILWRFVVLIAWTVTLLLLAVGVTDVWATLKG
jgi:hypothetical protein